MIIVICGTGPDQYIPERKLSECDWDHTVLAIARGEWEDISFVIHPAFGYDLLPSIAREVMTIWADREEPLTGWQRDFLERNVSVQAANKFAMEDAYVRNFATATRR